MIMRDIVIATNYNDWEGLYINGVLATQSHSLRIEDVLEALGIDYSYKEVKDYLYEYEVLPVDIKDIDEEA